jgi:hypothetical protein
LKIFQKGFPFFDLISPFNFNDTFKSSVIFTINLLALARAFERKGGLISGFARNQTTSPTFLASEVSKKIIEKITVKLHHT